MGNYSGSILAAGVLAFLAMAPGAGRSACAADPAPGVSLGKGDPAAVAADAEAQYQDVLAGLKWPAATGVLVTEIEPESPAGKAGLRAGDIITEFHTTHIVTLGDLRKELADDLAMQEVGSGKSTKAIVQVRRGEKVAILQVPLAPLEIRAMEVQAGVPGPRNPPADARGKVALDWKEASGAFAGDRGGGGDGGAVLRTTMVLSGENGGDGAGVGAATRAGGGGAAGGGTGQNSIPEEQWMGWQRFSVDEAGADAVSGQVVIHVAGADADAPAKAVATTLSFGMDTGDFKTSAAFILNDLTARYATDEGGGGGEIAVSGKRVGGELRVGLVSHGPEAEQNFTTDFVREMPQDGIPQGAIPFVAGALTHRGDAVLAVAPFSIRDFLARPGYVLWTRGKMALPALPGGAAGAEAKPEEGWRVDLMFCGETVEAYWFSDQDRLLCVRTEAPQAIISRRVASEEIAASALESAPAGTGPATLPAR